MPPIPELILYEHADFKGRRLVLRGTDNDLRRHNFNDVASSLEVVSGTWTLHEHVGFNGRAVTLKPGKYRWVEDLGFKNDLASSARLVGPTHAATGEHAITLHQHIDHGGTAQTFHDSAPDLRKTNFNDTVSSLTVHAGRWAIFEHVDYGGKSVVVGPGRYRWVEDLGFKNDTMSSIRLLDKPVAPPKPGNGTGEVVLYQHIDFGGTAKTFTDDVRDLIAEGFNDVVSSIVVKKGRWTFYDATGYGGKSVTLGPGRYRWVEAVGFQNDVMSSLKLVDKPTTTPVPKPAPTPGAPAVTLHQHINFGGTAKKYAGSVLDLRVEGFNDTVSSLTVHAGRWTFYEHVNHTGKSITLGPGKYRWVEDLGFQNDTLSSIKLEAVQVPVPVPTPTVPTPPVPIPTLPVPTPTLPAAPDLKPILTHIDAALANVVQPLGARIDAVQQHVDALGGRIDRITGGVGDVGGKVQTVHGAVDGVQETLSRIGTTVSAIDEATRIPEAVVEAVPEMALDYGAPVLLGTPHGTFLNLAGAPEPETSGAPDAPAVQTEVPRA